MSNNLSKIKNKISKKELILGTLVSFSDPIVSEVLCSCGFDFIWIDSEHQPLDKKDIDLHIMTVKGAGAAPFVRVPWNDPVLVKPILEMGPAGIIFPFIKTVEEAKLAVASCKYPPEGIRGYGPRRANRFSSISKDKYIEIAKVEPWIIVIIEHIDAVNNLKEILKVDGINSIVVGPEDLSGSIGLLGQTRHPELIKLLDKIAETCRDFKMPFAAGLSTTVMKDIEDWVQRGASWLLLDNDFSSLLFAGKKAYTDVKTISETGSKKTPGTGDKSKGDILTNNHIEVIVEEIMNKLRKKLK